MLDDDSDSGEIDPLTLPPATTRASCVLSLSSSIDFFSLSTHNEAYLEKTKSYNLTLTLIQEVVGVVFELAIPSAVEKVLLRRMLGITFFNDSDEG